MRTTKEKLHRLNELSAFKAGEFIVGYPAVSNESLISASEFVSATPTFDPGMFPSYEGGIQFEWNTAARDFELRFCNDGTVKYSSFTLNDMDSWFERTFSVEETSTEGWCDVVKSVMLNDKAFE